jgi:hypothetical protein
MTLYDSLGQKCQDELWMMAGEIIENYSEMFGYINTGRVNIRICRDIEGEMWFGVGQYTSGY